jgi:toxin ParE1/3/4
MEKFRLTRIAREDLDSIHAHIARDRPAAADKMLRQLLETIELLADHPGAGEAVHNLCPGVRRFTVPPYVVYFRPEADLILVLRILHGARDVSSAFFPHDKP